MITVNLIFAPAAHASETQTVYFHKQATKAGVTARDMLTEKQGVNGAEFTVVDITHFVRTHSTSHEEALEKAKAVTKEQIGGLSLGQAVPDHLGMNVVAKGKTERAMVPDQNGQMKEMDGVLKLSLARKNLAHDASYLFVETASVDSADPSDNLIFHFPVVDELTGEENTDPLHLYSKNDSLREEPVEPAIEKELAEKQPDFSYGEAIKYQIEVTVPTGIAQYDSFQVIDTPDPALLADTTSLQLTDKNGKKLKESAYKVTAKDNGFVIDFVPTKLVGIKKINVSYTLSIKQGAKPDTPFFNKAVLRYHDSVNAGEQSSTSKEVLTGGYRFVKVDSQDRKQKLKAASFVVKDQEDRYLTKSYGWKKSEKPDKDEDLLILESNQEGAFEIKGLAYGEYQLEEIIAPDGYRLLDKSIDFKIEKDTYLAGETTGTLEVLNSKLPNTGGGTTKSNTTNNGVQNDSPNTITNRITRNLPSTGEELLNVGILGGALVLLATAIYVFKNRQQKE